MRYVAYYRVSLDKQKKSGLGLEAQRAMVAKHLNEDDEIVAEFEEVESGRDNDRPKMAQAFATAKRLKATVIIAKLDRLSRSLAKIATLTETGTKFVICDMPHADETTIHLHALIARSESNKIKERTRDALRALKARGVKLGNPVTASQAAKTGKMTVTMAGAKGAATNARKAAVRASNVLPIIEKLKADGYTSLRQIAAELTARRVDGKQWHPQQVSRVLEKA